MFGPKEGEATYGKMTQLIMRKEQQAAPRITPSGPGKPIPKKLKVIH